MKLIFSLLIIFMSIIALLSYSNSYTIAKVNNNAAISIVSEENALIAISYGEDKTLSVSNNTDTIVELEQIEVFNGSDLMLMDVNENSSPIFMVGETKVFTILGTAEELTGNVIRLLVRWNEGQAEIFSVIPEFVEEKVGELVDEQDEELMKTEHEDVSEEDQINDEVDGSDSVVDEKDKIEEGEGN